MIADIYSHMLYQLSYAEGAGPHTKSVDTEGFEPSTSRMRNGRSSTELSAHAFSGALLTGWLHLVRSYPSGHGAGPEIQWAMPAQVRTLPIAHFPKIAGQAELNRCGAPRLQV